MTYRYNEVVLGLQALVWGFILTLPGDLFVSVRRFGPLANLYPDWVFGTILIVLSFGILYRLPLRMRLIVHLLLFGMWLFMCSLTVAGGLSDITILIGWPYLTIALLHAGKFWRLRQDSTLKWTR